ncbi:MAG: YHS domain-containing protein [bacterium]|nr:YHS domain-containing protein [bacterium]
MKAIGALFKKLSRVSKFKPQTLSKDPVCGMLPTDIITYEYQGIKYTFCSDHCKEQFISNPNNYIRNL